VLRAPARRGGRSWSFPAIHNSSAAWSVSRLLRWRGIDLRSSKRFAIKISHALMIAGSADFATVDTVMAHPQVLRQLAATKPREEIRESRQDERCR